MSTETSKVEFLKLYLASWLQMLMAMLLEYGQASDGTTL